MLRLIITLFIIIFSITTSICRLPPLKINLLIRSLNLIHFFRLFAISFSTSNCLFVRPNKFKGDTIIFIVFITCLLLVMNLFLYLNYSLNQVFFFFFFYRRKIANQVFFFLKNKKNQDILINLDLRHI